jgi:phenolic acid decarboxylase
MPKKESAQQMVDTMLGKAIRWHQSGLYYADSKEGFEPQPWLFEPMKIAADHIEYTLVKGPHAGRKGVQRIYYQRVSSNVEFLSWCEESGTVLHVTWFLDSQTTHRIAFVPAWLAATFGENFEEIYGGDSNDPEFRDRIKKLAEEGDDMPRKVITAIGYFEVLESDGEADL